MSFIYSNLQYSEFESAKVAWPPVGCDHPATTKQPERHLYKSGTEGGEGTAPPLCTHFLRVPRRLHFSPLSVLPSTRVQRLFQN